MSEGGRQFVLEGVRADLRVLAEVRRRVAEFAGEIDLPPDTTGDVLLATYEALANVVEHAYPPGVPGTFDLVVDYSRGDGVLTVTVADRGSWKPESDTRVTRRGQGLRLMNACSDAVRVERRDAGTRIQLQWNCGQARTLLPEREPQTGR
ncbi:ATP-binding protein [Rhodococcus zopfii]|uniref:ATP-binding protein n=1 Tax=Rhodococcus zopfii TaxID=43772 RepID=UPI003658F618